MTAKGRREPEKVALSRLKHRSFALFIDRGFLFSRTLVKSAAAVVSVYLGHEMVLKLADGKIDWNAVAAALLTGRAINWILLGVTGISIAVALYERSLRRNVTASQSEYIKKLEQIVDPNRSSSRLLPEGRNREGDNS